MTQDGNTLHLVLPVYCNLATPAREVPVVGEAGTPSLHAHNEIVAKMIPCMVHTNMAPTPMPAPIPAFAPVDIPAGSSDDAGVSDAELDDGDVSLVVVACVDVATVTEEDVSEITNAVVDVDSSVNTVPTTVYSFAFRFHVAHTFGLDGRTANLPTPLLQQPEL
ncbi:hypothetical protein HYE68_000922 [Fusarium pseudograminearum]|nr:hypothetical protein HYE68_000922 [Fusarium pseudograminearum]